MSITGYRLTGARSITAAELPDPKPSEGEILIEVARAGICGSDIEYFNQFKCGVFVPEKPLVLGHEFAGTVIEHGSGVSSPAVGSRVALEPSVPCGTCTYCREGRYNLCDNMRFFGTAATKPHIDGGFRRRAAVPASNVIELPKKVTAGGGALLEPLAVAVHAVRRARPVDDANVLVTGGGTIGQLVAMVLRAYGAGRVTVSDPVLPRRQFAVEHGVNGVVDPTTDSLTDLAREQPRGGYDIVLEASGREDAIGDGIAAARKGGRFVQIGTIPEPIRIPANLIMVKELDFRGTFRYNHDFPAALRLLETDRIPAMDVVTAIFPFSDTPAAFAAAASGAELKVHVEVSE